MRTFVAIALFQGWVSVALAESPPPLTPIGAIARDGASGISTPVRVRGIVIYCDPNCRRLNIQDGDVALVARIPLDTLQYRPGQRVELSGKAIANDLFDAESVQFLNDDKTPKAIAAFGSDLAAGRLAGRRLRTAAVVRSFAIEGDRAVLRARSGRIPIRISIREAPPRPLNLERYVDAEVLVTGVRGAAVAGNSPTPEVELLVQSFEDVTIDRPGPISPFALTPIAGNKIPEWANHRIRIAGLAAGPAQAVFSRLTWTDTRLTSSAPTISSLVPGNDSKLSASRLGATAGRCSKMPWSGGLLLRGRRRRALSCCQSSNPSASCDGCGQWKRQRAIRLGSGLP